MSRLTAYLHPTCSTCEQARVWLHRHKLAFVEKDIRTSPPGVPELRAMLAAYGGERKKLLNTSGIEYRKQGLAAKLPALDDAAALALLAGNGMLIKRPFVLGPGGRGLVGFDEGKWAGVFLPA
ncbi:MAG TPA: ArsC/Spx/MgsR family protein [Lacunisphaera sp.]|nr:arsenate reductase family protein [Lacunisphaera sp.]HQY05541.1 ArsC/Spx/MgsR family protein [Lacunisphaera sp.]